MTDGTRNIEDALVYVNTFFHEVAQMVRDTIELMDKEEWRVQESESTDGLSYAIDNPDRWMVRYLYKNFKRNKADSFSKGLLVFFNKPQNNFPFSLVCGNVYAEKYHKWNLYWAHSEHKKMLQTIPQHTEREVKFKNVNKPELGELKAKLFIVPLEDITSKEALNELVVQRLLNLE